MRIAVHSSNVASRKCIIAHLASASSSLVHAIRCADLTVCGRTHSMWAVSMYSEAVCCPRNVVLSSNVALASAGSMLAWCITSGIILSHATIVSKRGHVGLVYDHSQVTRYFDKELLWHSSKRLHLWRHQLSQWSWAGTVVRLYRAMGELAHLFHCQYIF